MAPHDLKLSTLNTRGMRNTLKRKTVFRYLKEKKPDIVTLQETYITDSVIDEWNKQWKGHFFCSTGTVHSNGLITLVNSKLAYDSAECVYNSARILIIKIVIDSITYAIINFLMGDFNMIMNDDLDNLAGLPHNIQETEFFKETMQSLDLYDVWRCTHGEEKDFSWSKLAPFTARRLDYIFCDLMSLNSTKEATIESMVNSDHRMVSMILQNNKFSRGPGTWKFNNNLLKDADYVQTINTLIDDHIIEYEECSREQCWELLKVKIKSTSIEHSKIKSQQNRNKYQQLMIELEKEETRIKEDPGNQVTIHKIAKLRRELELVDLNRARGAQVRARIKWTEEGERNTAFFFRLEKSRGNSGTITNIKQDNKHAETPTEILKVIKNFYENLYKTSNADETRAMKNNFIRENDLPKLSATDRNSCEGHLTASEVTEALLSLNQDSAPGSDGLTPAFYKHFWGKLQRPFLDCLDESIKEGRLTFSQRRGTITLIHKGKNLDRNDLSNYRPITLTNTDYKIITKAMAYRLQNVTQEVVDEDQVGFIRGRNIATHIRMIDDIVNKLLVENKSGALMALDFSKAFDTLSKKCILEALSLFNFGPDFIKLVSTVMNDTNACVQNGGWISDSFPTERGIRQGCPLSPLLFVLAVEIMAIRIRKDKGIKGISLGAAGDSKEQKIIQYADDTSLTLADEASIRKTIEIVEDFGKYSGLKLSTQKSTGMWLGSRRQENGFIKGIPMARRNIKILGIYFSPDTEASLIPENWSDRIENIIRTIKRWENRNPSLYGKVLLAKTLLISQLNHVIQALAIPKQTLARINTIIYRFLWKKKYNNKRAFEKIKRNVLSLNVKDGGLGMINIEHQQKMFLTKWATKLVKGTRQAWSIVPEAMFNKIGGSQCALSISTDIKNWLEKQHIKSHFWRQVVSTMAELNEKNTVTGVIPLEPLWYNKHIQFKGKPVFSARWAAAGLNRLQDIFENGQLLTRHEIEGKTGSYASLMFDYNAITNALPEDWKQRMQNETEQIEIENTLCFEGENITRMNNKTIRNVFVTMQNHEICAVHFWRQKLGIDITDYFNTAHECTKESRLRLLHYKFLHNIYPTNIMLEKMGVACNNKCMWCDETDYIEHAFYQCRKLKPFWAGIKSFILAEANLQIEMNERTALFGVPKTMGPSRARKKLNHILLIARLCISKFKYGKIKNLDVLFQTECHLRGIK